MQTFIIVVQCNCKHHNIKVQFSFAVSLIHHDHDMWFKLCWQCDVDIYIAGLFPCGRLLSNLYLSYGLHSPCIANELPTVFHQSASFQAKVNDLKIIILYASRNLHALVQCLILWIRLRHILHFKLLVLSVWLVLISFEFLYLLLIIRVYGMLKNFWFIGCTDGSLSRVSAASPQPCDFHTHSWVWLVCIMSECALIWFSPFEKFSFIHIERIVLILRKNTSFWTQLKFSNIFFSLWVYFR
jgi:hypothetical protein